MADDEEALKCTNCTKSFQLSEKKKYPRIPLLLACGHTFCAQCIPKFSPSSTKSIKCPFCHQIAPFDPSLAAQQQFPPNLYMVGLTYCREHSLSRVVRDSTACKILHSDMWSDLEPVPPSPGPVTDLIKPCEECKLSTRQKCRQCGVPLCKNCFKLTHSSAAFLRKHNLVAVLSCKFSSCVIHDLKMDRFCSDCQTVFCQQCQDKHNDHSTSAVAEKSDELREQLHPLLDIARRMLRCMKRSHLTISGEGLTSLREQFLRLIKELDQHFLSMHSTLQTRYLTLTNNLAVITQSQAGSLTTMCCQLKDGIEKVTECVTYVQDVMEDSLQLVECGEKILQEFNILVDLPCQLKDRGPGDSTGYQLDEGVEEYLKNVGSASSPKKPRYELSCLSTEKGGDTPISLSESEDVVMETSQPQSKVTMLACREGSSQSLGDENSDASMEGYSSDEDIQDNEDSQLCESSIDTTPLLQAKGMDHSKGAVVNSSSVYSTPSKIHKTEDTNFQLSSPSPIRTTPVGRRVVDTSVLQLVKLKLSSPSEPGQVSDSHLVINGTPPGKVAKVRNSVATESETNQETSASSPTGHDPVREAPSSSARSTPSHPPAHKLEGGLVRMMRVENPGKFYVRFVRDNDQYNWVMKRLNNRTANQKSVHTKDIHIGGVYAVVYSVGGEQLYRGEVVAMPTKIFSYYTIKFIDIGDMESVKPERIFPLSEGAEGIPPLVYRCKLANVSPIQLSNKSSWSDRATLSFKTQTNDRDLKLNIVSQNEESLIVDLYYELTSDEWVCVASKLTEKGLAHQDDPYVEHFDLSLQELPQESILIDCVVSYCRAPDSFYIQILSSNTESLSSLMNQIQLEIVLSKEIINPQPDVLCLALFHEDSQWYRARILEVLEESDEVSVYFVDFGNCDIVPVDHLRNIKQEYLSLPAQAIPSKVTKLLPQDGISWSEGASKYFSSLVNNKRIQAELHEREGEVALLCIKSPPVNDLLVQKKFGRYCGAVVFPPPILPQVGEVFRGYVVQVKTPSSFHLRRFDQEVDQQLSRCLEQISPKSPLVSKWSLGDCCCSFFSNDKSLHRVMVVRQVSDSSYEVYYVDYGNKEVVESKNMIPVSQPELFCIPQQAFCCKLHGVQSVDSSWSVGANIYFSSTVTGQMVTAKVEDMDMKEKASLSVSLTISSSPDSMSLVDGLVDSGYALPAVALVPKYDGPTYLPHPLPTDKEFVMAVVCVESDGQIVGQLESDRDILTALMTKVQEVCNAIKDRPTSTDSIYRGQPCCARFSEDNTWYRAVVEDIVESSLILVCYVDFGNCEEVSLTDFIPEPVSLEVPNLTVRLNLLHSEGIIWNEHKAQLLTEIVSEQQVNVIMDAATAGTTIYGSVYRESGQNVMDMLTERLIV